MVGTELPEFLVYFRLLLPQILQLFLAHRFCIFFRKLLNISVATAISGRTSGRPFAAAAKELHSDIRARVAFAAIRICYSSAFFTLFHFLLYPVKIKRNFWVTVAVDLARLLLATVTLSRIASFPHVHVRNLLLQLIIKYRRLFLVDNLWLRRLAFANLPHCKGKKAKPTAPHPKRTILSRKCQDL